MRAGGIVMGLGFLAAAPVLARAEEAAPRNVDEVVVTAARTILPVNALPLTVDVLDRTVLDQQVAIGGSIVDAVANLTPSFSPTRQKLSGAGETLRGRSPLYAITASRSRPRCATARATASRSTPSSSTGWR